MRRYIFYLTIALGIALGLHLAFDKVNGIGKCEEDKAAQNEIDGSMLIGWWQDSPTVRSGRSDSHSFYPDGDYRFIFNEMDGLDRRMYMDGSWEIEDGALKITVVSMTSKHGGNIAFREGYYAKGAVITEEKIEPPYVRVFPIDGLYWHQDKTYPSDIWYICEFSSAYEHEEPPEEILNTRKYVLKQAFFLDGTQYWKIDSFPVPRNDEEEQKFFELNPDWN